MNETILGNQLRKVPSIAVGCMRLSEKSKEEMNHFIHSALEQGAYFFDHADIYGGGMSETVFGDAFSHDPSLKREDVFLQSKCGIRQGCYDLSKEYILEAVDGILKRLRTDYLDLLLLHRPDALVEPEEVAAACRCNLSCPPGCEKRDIGNIYQQIETVRRYYKLLQGSRQILCDSGRPRGSNYGIARSCQRF